MYLTVAGLDPSLRNFGYARGVYDTETGTLTMIDIDMVQTESETGKTVRQSSDDLRCANEISTVMHNWVHDVDAVFAEIPSGSQSARGSFSNGVCLGILSSIGAVGDFDGKLIQVTPTEVKKAAVGSKNASKIEMIEWARANYPDLPWKIAKSGRTKGQPTADNEHMADACGAINAGINTDQFKSLIQMLKAFEQKQSSKKSALATQ